MVEFEIIKVSRALTNRRGTNHSDEIEKENLLQIPLLSLEESTYQIKQGEKITQNL